ncbi:YhfX family PLP-dependent enzyme [Tepidimicrobium xylanilyticum]|uniref:Predicted amino acid racemase n=1 Tax=Tepidimicrobium xylanilyticum TaxID=1123352 RepID=A0A1H2RF35_9FIRM|nr:Predicted amino acid racemase [Tepidimicrobium xylanilyticum]
MFLDITIRRNVELIDAAVYFHQKGEIKPNTYVLDIDNIVDNAKRIKEEADRNKIKLYMMTKQIGRNPEIAKMISEIGIDKAVAVDPWEAMTLTRNGIKIGNVGHLVQIPSNMVKCVVSLDPEVITVFTIEKAREISEEAERQGKVQDILLKVIGNEDLIYEGQNGGFKISELEKTAKEIKRLKGVRIVGVTAFPCFLYDSKGRQIIKTPNSKTLMESARILREELNLELKQINAPSANSIASIPILKEIGANYGEPGHAFTGTIPINADIDQPEVPAIVYVSEVSHIYDGVAYAYGGGFYRRGNLKKALVGRNLDDSLNNMLDVIPLSPTNIDYYGGLKIKDREVRVGETVIYAFRTQIFVTRSEVALVKGIKEGKPELMGIYDSLGNRLK